MLSVMSPGRQGLSLGAACRQALDWAWVIGGRVRTWIIMRQPPWPGAPRRMSSSKLLAFLEGL